MVKDLKEKVSPSTPTSFLALKDGKREVSAV